ncbi:MAG TPA: tyrosine--tRNA ligase [Myxococcaceae bacterium]|nr:tyrosine--tRNA ligase [Myxococcaceae bacterium]
MPVDLRSATPDEQLAEVTRASVDLHVKDELIAKLKRSYETRKPLHVKTGFDPNRPDLHLGHSLVLTRMRRFQEFGHHVVFLMGDFTGMIGDPTGKNVTRPPLTREEVTANAETYRQQVFKVLDPALTEVRFNSEWLDKLGSEGMLRLSSRYTVARMLERDDFKKRFKEGASIAIHELMYPLLQGYDSVALKSDVELGGTDQLFNLLVGRHLMREYELEPQVIMTGPILEGLDGVNKMSKSLDNYVGINEPAPEIFGKLMSISDDLMWRYLELLSSKRLEEIAALKGGGAHPMDVKKDFAQEITARFQGAEAAKKAREGFEQKFSRKELNVAELEVFKVASGGGKVLLARALAEAKLAESATKARTLIGQGGVRINGEKVADSRTELGPGEYVAQVGKLKAAKLVIE